MAGFPAVDANLDLVENEDRLTHYVALDAPDLKAQTEIDVFQEDPEFEEHEKQWQVSLIWGV